MHEPIYLDNHSTTPLDPAVLTAMMPYLTQKFGNPSSKSHAFGWAAEAALEQARERVGKLIGASAAEIIFTSNCTEANNIALQGLAMQHPKGHLITSAIEHKCVLQTARSLRERGWSVTFIPVDQYGQVQVEAVEAAILPATRLISIMMANNEVGTINPIAKIGALAKSRGILFHTDAAQAAGKIAIDVQTMGIDMLSLSAHKFYGPKGVGALYIRRRDPRVVLKPIIYGGGQEQGLRSGTHNVAGIVGLGEACVIALDQWKSDHERVHSLREQLWKGLNDQLGNIFLNGHPSDRLPGSLNVSFPPLESDAIVAGLKHIAVSSTSACMSVEAEPSYVLNAMKTPTERIHSSIRIGLGRFTTAQEIQHTIQSFTELVDRLRKNLPHYQAP